MYTSISQRMQLRNVVFGEAVWRSLRDLYPPNKPNAHPA